MKKYWWISVCALFSLGLFGQAKKPTLMVVPADNYLIEKGYVQEIEMDGRTRKFPDYRKALQEDSELLLVISKINTMMGDRGFPLRDMESSLRRQEQEMAEEMLTVDKDGEGLAETPLDQLKRSAKADIILQLNWEVNKTGPRRSITFNLRGIDAYTDKQIAGAQGTGEPSYATETPVLLEEAVLAHMDNFNARLQNHFNDLFEKGREVTVSVRKWQDFEGDLYTEYQGEELGYLIEDWMADNTVSGRFTTADATENMLVFEQVRIPLYDERGRATDTRRFVRDLQKYLRKEFDIPSSISMRGLGQATLIIGKR